MPQRGLMDGHLSHSQNCPRPTFDERRQPATRPSRRARRAGSP